MDRGREGYGERKRGIWRDGDMDIDRGRDGEKDICKQVGGEE